MTNSANDNAEDTQARPMPRMKDGVILDADGKPCRTCYSLKAWSAFNAKTRPKGSSSSVTQSDTVPSSSEDSVVPRDDCPADVEVLGRHTWTFLHTTAAHYPSHPSQSHQSSMLSLLNSLPTLYPCSHCASELDQEIKRHPPDVSSGSRLSQWLCGIHNEVNRRLEKPEFNCDLVDERWKDGWKDGRCD